MLMPNIFGESLFDDFMDILLFRTSIKNCMGNMLPIS